MKFDDILVKYIGEFGRYQKIQFFLVCVPTIFTAMHSLSWTFTGAKIDYRCKLPGEPNDKISDAKNESFFLTNDYRKWLKNEKDQIVNGCQRSQSLNFEQVKEKSAHDLHNSSTESCLDGFVYDHGEIKFSAIEQWEFTCGQSWKVAFVQSMYYIGQFFGSFCFGILSDMIGRKKSFFAAIFLQVLCGSLMAYVPWWPVFALLRIGIGFAHPGIFLIAVVIGMELVGPRYRVMAGVLTGLFFSFGQIFLVILAYFIRDYQQLQLAISLPALIFIFYWWFVPESARWLISQKRFDEADVILQKAAKCNGKTLPQDWRDLLDKEANIDKPDAKRYGMLDLFKTPRLRHRILLTSLVCWPAVSMVYYGISMNTNFMGGDRYYTFLTSATFEIPALLIVMVSMNQIGRKLLTLFGFLLAALSLLFTMLIPSGYTVLQTIMVTMGKMTLCAVYALLYVFTPELFPTIVRSNAMGLCSMVARVGAVSASYIAMWLVYHSPTAGVLIFGSMCLAAAVSAFFLPETTGQKQFDTIEDAERFGKRLPLFSFEWKNKLDDNAEHLTEMQDVTRADRELLDKVKQAQIA